MDHSVRGYLERRSTEELEGILLYLQGDKEEEYAENIALIHQILAQRKIQEEQNT